MINYWLGAFGPRPAVPMDYFAMRLHLLVSSRSKEAKYTERFPDGILKTLEQIQSEKDYKEKFTFDYRYDAKHLPLIFGYVMNGKVLNCDDKESGKED